MNQLLVSKHLEPFPGFLLLLSMGPDEAPPVMSYVVTAAHFPRSLSGLTLITDGKILTMFFLSSNKHLHVLSLFPHPFHHNPQRDQNWPSVLALKLA